MSHMEQQPQEEGEFLSPPTLYGALGGVLGAAATVAALAYMNGWTGDWDGQNTAVLLAITAICGLVGSFFGYKLRRRAFVGGLLIGALLAVPVMNGVEAVRMMMA